MRESETCLFYTNFQLFGFVSLFLCHLFLIPGLLSAQQEDSSNNPPPSALSDSKDQTPIEDYFNCLNACSKSLMPEQYFNCLHACSYPTVTLERKIPKPLIQEELVHDEHVEKRFDSIIQERLSCYAQTSSIHIRLRSCRKEYTRKVMKLAKQISRAIRSTRRFKPKRGHRKMGSFVICVRECPISLALCRGDVALGKYEGTCDKKELQCLEGCFSDYYL